MTGKWEILIKCKTVRATCKNLELWTELSCFSVSSLRCISWPCVAYFQLRAGYAPATHLAPSPLFPSKEKLQCDLDDCGTGTSSALFPELGRYEPQEILLNPWETYWHVSVKTVVEPWTFHPHRQAGDGPSTPMDLLPWRFPRGTWWCPTCSAGSCCRLWNQCPSISDKVNTQQCRAFRTSCYMQMLNTNWK